LSYINLSTNIRNLTFYYTASGGKVVYLDEKIPSQHYKNIALVININSSK